MRKRTTKKKGPTLAEYAVLYTHARDLSYNYSINFKHTINKFEEFCGRVVYIKELDCDTLNRWLFALQEVKTNPRTVHNYRAKIVAVWRDAYVAGLNDNPPLRVRKIKRPRLSIECYTHAEIRKLLGAAAELPGFYSNGVKIADFWQAAIHAGYSTGLRRGDLLAVKRAQIREDGIATVVQQKTGYPVTVQFSAEAMQFFRLWKFEPETPALPWPFQPTTFSRAFNLLCKASHVDRGTFKWFRRAAGSFAERERHGDGSKILGHRVESVFRQHYEDTSVTATVAVAPPAIGL